MKKFKWFVLTDKSEKTSVITFVFFLAFFILGLFIVDDYGMSWDEEVQRIHNGRVVYDFIFHGKKAEYLKEIEKYHGPAIEWPLYTMEKILRIDDTRYIYLFRHISIFILFFISSVFFYKLIRALYNSWGLAMLGTVIYIASPRIFADAFYNTKDIGSLVFLTIGMYTGMLYMKNQQWKNTIAHGFICGVLIATRVTGIMLPVITIAVLLFQKLLLWKPAEVKKLLLNIVALIVITYVSICIFWPIMIFTPKHLYLAILEMSSYGWDGVTMFMGNFVRSKNLPLDYVPVWIGISTPALVLVLLLIAFLFLFIDALMFRKRNNFIFYNNLVFLGLFSAPIFAVMYYHSVLYDGWRHLYFINAPMVALGCYALYRLKQVLPSVVNKYVYAVAACCMLPVIWLMISMHPYQNVYFNRIAFRNAGEAKFKFEMDYWGLSYREGLQFILDTDPRKKILVYGDSYPCLLNTHILKPADRARLIIVKEKDKRKADYFLGNYRWANQEYMETNVVFYVTADKARILSCIKQHN